ncbi:MAG: DUF2273 domain-containing protein [Tissierella sp.]|nr:DUF2273 domain-containing protein [Tissierella sp.]
MIKDTLDEILIWINQNKRKFVGGLLGFLISVLTISIGLFKTLFIIICTTTGYILGSYDIGLEDIKRAIMKMFSDR